MNLIIENDTYFITKLHDSYRVFKNGKMTDTEYNDFDEAVNDIDYSWGSSFKWLIIACRSISFPVMPIQIKSSSKLL